MERVLFLEINELKKKVSEVEREKKALTALMVMEEERVIIEVQE